MSSTVHLDDDAAPKRPASVPATARPVNGGGSAKRAAAGTGTQYEDRVVHEYDGIEEYDNHLPNWWLYTLYGTIIFALGYWFHYQVFQTGETPRQAYEREMAPIRAEAARRARAAPVSATMLRTLAQDPATVRQGREIFQANCIPCHGANAGGTLLAPNLTDGFWLHGGQPEQVYHTVTEGVRDRGMQAWGPVLGPERIQSVVAYLLTVRNSNVAGGRPPQGQHEE